MKWIFYVLVAATGFAQSADKCTGLAKFQMPGATIEITSASMVAAGQAPADAEDAVDQRVRCCRRIAA